MHIYTVVSQYFCLVIINEDYVYFKTHFCLFKGKLSILRLSLCLNGELIFYQPHSLHTALMHPFTQILCLQSHLSHWKTVSYKFVSMCLMVSPFTLFC